MASKRVKKLLKRLSKPLAVVAAVATGGVIGAGIVKAQQKSKELAEIRRAVKIEKKVVLQQQTTGVPVAKTAETAPIQESKFPYGIIGVVVVGVIIILFLMRKA